MGTLKILIMDVVHFEHHVLIALKIYLNEVKRIFPNLSI